jgi:hypothetical protein
MDLTGYDYKRKVAEQKISAAPVQPAAPAEPSADLTDAAVRLMNTLARKCPLKQVSARFPRVLNRLAAMWGQPHLVERCFQELLIDSRGKRAGFPLEVLTELQALRNCNAQRIVPARVDPWQEMYLR